MKKNAIILFFMLFSLSLFGQVKCNQRYQTYIDRYYNFAIEQMLKYHIPASITLAQGLLESGAGCSELSVRGNNHFGIKCHGWTGRKSYHDDDESQECFRAYNSPLESFEDHSILLSTQPRYKFLFNLNMRDYKGWAHGLKKAGYATSPTYAQKLIDIIEAYRLDKFDHVTSFNKLPQESPSDVGDVTEEAVPHTIYSYNKNLFVKARKGDTFKSIAKELGLSYRKLARYNERDKNSSLSQGDVVYLKKKQNKAIKKYKKVPYVVKAGDSMYDISQMYGIRLSCLYKMNKLSPDYSPKVGDRLRIR